MQMLRKCNALKFGNIQECRAKPCHQTLVVVPLRLEVLHILRKLEYKLLRKDYLQINIFPDLMVVKQEKYLHALQIKAIRGTTNKVVRKTASQTWPGLIFGTLILASTIYHTTR